MNLYFSPYANVVFPAISRQFASTFLVGDWPSLFLAWVILSIEAVYIQKMMTTTWVKGFVGAQKESIFSTMLLISSIPTTVRKSSKFFVPGGGRRNFLL